MRRTHELMTPDPITVHPDTPVASCAQRMATHGIRHLPVVTRAGKVTGLVTDAQVFRHGALAGEHHELWMPRPESPADLTAQQILEPNLVTVTRDAPLRTTLRSLIDAPQDIVLVTDDTGVLAGVLTEHDGVRLAADLLTGSRRTLGTNGAQHVYTADADARAADAADTMDLQGIRHLVVLEEGAPLGVISLADLIAADVRNHTSKRVREVVHRPEVMTIAPDAGIAEAASRMVGHRIGCLPVTDAQGALVGMLTRTDLIEAAVAAMEDDSGLDGAHA